MTQYLAYQCPHCGMYLVRHFQERIKIPELRYKCTYCNKSGKFWSKRKAYQMVNVAIQTESAQEARFICMTKNAYKRKNA